MTIVITGFRYLILPVEDPVVALLLGFRLSQFCAAFLDMTFVLWLMDQDTGQRTGWPYKSWSRDPIFTAWTPHHFDDTVGEKNHFAGQHNYQIRPVQIRSDLRPVTLAERNRSHSSRSLFAQRRRCRCCNGDVPSQWRRVIVGPLGLQNP